MIDERFTSPVSGFLYINEENEIPISLTGKNVSLTLCDRNSITSNLGNYFVSLNLPTKTEDFPQNSSMFFFYPELQQFNVDRILLIKIGNTAYTEYIDSRSIKLNIPGTGSSANFYTLFSSTYSDSEPDKHGERSPLLGDNIAYLFSDSVNLPYTGFSVNQVGQLISHSAVTTWRGRDGNYKNRPSATSYEEIKGSNSSINSDRRYRINKSVFIDGLTPDFRGQAIGYYDTVNVAGNKVGLVVLPDRNYFQVGDVVTIDEFNHLLNPSYSGNVTITQIDKNYTTNVFFNYAPNGYTGPFDLIRTDLNWVNVSQDEAGILYISGGTYYNYDIPVGFAILDKGLIAITHTDIVNSIDWTSGFLPDGSPSDGTIGSGTTDIYFTDAAISIYGDEEPTCMLNFTSLDRVFKLRTICNSLIGQFYISNNPTWDNALASSPYSTNQKVAITEVGLYNQLNELVAISKFSEPVYKGVLDIMSFELDINL